MKFLDRLRTSSKWQVGFIALVWSVGQPVWVEWGMTEDQVQNGFVALLGILGAQAVTDFGKEKTA